MSGRDPRRRLGGLSNASSGDALPTRSWLLNKTRYDNWLAEPTKGRRFLLSGVAVATGASPGTAGELESTAPSGTSQV